MNCAEIRDDLSALVDGELPVPRRAEIETHMAVCPHCRQRVAELRQLAAGIAALPKLQPAPQFLADVRRQIAADKTPRRDRWADMFFHPFWPKVPLEVAAAVAVLVIVSALVLRQPPMPARPIRDEMAQANAPEAKPAAPAGSAIAAPETPAPTAMPPFEQEADALRLKSTYEYRADVASAENERARETIVIADNDFAVVRDRATQLAAALGGTAQLPATGDAEGPAKSLQMMTNTLIVTLPTANVAAFTSQLTTPVAQDRLAGGEKEGALGELSGARKAEVAGSDGAGSRGAEPVTVLEIQVVRVPRN